MFHFFKRWKLHMAQFYWPSTSLGRSCPYKGFKLNFLPIIFKKIYLYNKVGTHKEAKATMTSLPKKRKLKKIIIQEKKGKKKLIKYLKRLLKLQSMVLRQSVPSNPTIMIAFLWGNLQLPNSHFFINKYICFNIFIFIFKKNFSPLRDSLVDSSYVRP